MPIIGDLLEGLFRIISISLSSGLNSSYFVNVYNGVRTTWFRYCLPTLAMCETNFLVLGSYFFIFFDLGALAVRWQDQINGAFPSLIIDRPRLMVKTYTQYADSTSHLVKKKILPLVPS